MVRKSEPTPAQLRMILGENLRQLGERRGSVSQICREVGINRTQYIRYLSGEAFPRPDVLYRICAYFDVDARILLEPLEAQGAPATTERFLDNLRRYTLKGRYLPLDTKQASLGFYQFWRWSFAVPNKVVRNVGLIKELDGVAMFCAYENVNLVQSAMREKGSRRYKFHGNIFQHRDGISILTCAYDDFTLNFTYLERDVSMKWTDCLIGTSQIGRRLLPDTPRISPIIFEPLPNDFGAIRRASRDYGVRPLDECPANIQSFFMANGEIR